MKSWVMHCQTVWTYADQRVCTILFESLLSSATCNWSLHSLSIIPFWSIFSVSFLFSWGFPFLPPFAFNTTNFFLDLPAPLIDLLTCSIFSNSHSLCLQSSLFFFPLASWKPSSPLLPPSPPILPIILLLYLRLILTLLFTSAIGKSFAFVEFSTHQFAKSVVEASVRRGISLKGRTISVGEWGGQTMEHMEDSSWAREWVRRKDMEIGRASCRERV